MYARIARLEGADAARIETEVAEMKAQMDAGRSGQLPPGAPEQAQVLMEAVKRVLMLADRGSPDEALNEMPPSEGAGRRTSVETYEVLLDESFV